MRWKEMETSFKMRILNSKVTKPWLLRMNFNAIRKWGKHHGLGPYLKMDT